MQIEDFWNRLTRYGITVPEDVQHRVGKDLCQERVMIRPPVGTVSGKARVLAYGTDVAADVVARQAGVTVQYVRRVRSLLR